MKKNGKKNEMPEIGKISPEIFEEIIFPRLGAKNQNVLVDLHGLDISNQGYIQSLPIETFCPDLIVIVEASYEDIILRRVGDETRNRSMVDLKSLDEQFQLLRMSMMSAAVLCGAFLKILYNDDFDSCVHELVTLLS